MEKIEPKITEITDKRRKGRINKLNQIKYKKDKKQGEMNMRKNVNKKSNNRSKVVSALAMLLVSAVALSSASYAWFTMSKQVEVKGIELTATAPDNVLIATNTAYETIGDYASVKQLVVTDATNGKKDVLKGDTTTPISGTDLLLPSSSVNGLNLYDTENVEDEGQDKDGALYKKSTNATELYYVDVPLYILTTGSGDVNVAIDTEKSKVTGTDGGIVNAVRFAVLEDTSSKGVYAINKEMFKKNETDVKPVSNVANPDNITGLGTPTYDKCDVITVGAKNADEQTAANKNKITLKGTGNDGFNANVDTGATNKYEYTKVIVRIWIEGQSLYCKTANAKQKFNFDLTFKAVD